MKKIIGQKATHGIAHTYLNLEKLLSRDDVMIDSGAGAEIERLARHLRELEKTILEGMR